MVDVTTENPGSPRARKVKTQWKLRLLQRIREIKRSIVLQKVAVKDIEWNEENFDMQMQLKAAQIAFDLVKITYEDEHFDEDKENTKIQLEDQKAKFAEQLRIMENNQKVLEKQLKEGLKSEIKKTK